jgi:hypothetical protein
MCFLLMCSWTRLSCRLFWSGGSIPLQWHIRASEGHHKPTRNSATKSGTMNAALNIVMDFGAMMNPKQQSKSPTAPDK